jgi:guanylate kinase
MLSSAGTGLLFTVVGPTGVGKNALMNDALDHIAALQQMPTATTRPRRPNEQDGRERLFVAPDEFRRMIEDNALLEWQEVHRNRFYGVPRAPLEHALATGQYLIADIDVLGATYIRSLYPQNVILIFVQPPSVDTLADRMQERGDDETDIHTRLTRVAMEMTYLPVADYVVQNDDFDLAAQRFREIVELECTHPSERQFEHWVEVLPVYEQDVLVRAAVPAFLLDRLHPHEIPHNAALRMIGSHLAVTPTVDHLLRIKPHKGSFVSPAKVSVETRDNIKRITFTYLYLLPERPETGPEWHWQPLDTLLLPEMTREAWQQLRHLQG